jgi:4-hydroxybutyrate CoA-transferase
VAQIPPRARVVLPHGGIDPRAVYDAIAASPGRPDAPATLYTGLQFGDYGFLGPGLRGGAATTGGLGPGFRFVTWQVGPAVRALARAGRVGVLPVRFRDIPRMFGPSGRLAADVAVIQCAPPVGGFVNLGVSCSIFPSVVAAARLVIAEIHPDMPRTAGDTDLPASAIDYAVDATAPLGTLARAVPDAVDEQIIARVLALVPENAWVQLGVGAIPDAILSRLHDVPGVKLHSGMLTDPLLDFLDRAPADARVVTGEVEGSHEMYARAARDPRVTFRPTTFIHDVPSMARLARFVSINSAIEVDLDGQVNGETIGGAQVSGVGGSLDFVEAARYSPGGRSLIALRSTAKGRSRIVDRLATGTAVTIPRHAVDVVITEHGVAELAGLDLDERAEALIEIADPGSRAELRDQLHERRGRAGRA